MDRLNAELRRGLQAVHAMKTARIDAPLTPSAARRSVGSPGEASPGPSPGRVDELRALLRDVRHEVSNLGDDLAREKAERSRAVEGLQQSLDATRPPRLSVGSDDDCGPVWPVETTMRLASTGNSPLGSTFGSAVICEGIGVRPTAGSRECSDGSHLAASPSLPEVEDCSDGSLCSTALAAEFSGFEHTSTFLMAEDAEHSCQVVSEPGPSPARIWVPAPHGSSRPHVNGTQRAAGGLVGIEAESAHFFLPPPRVVDGTAGEPASPDLGNYVPR